MLNARVWNDNDLQHTETFKGETIVIAPHRSIEMDRDEAVQFLGQFYPMKTDGERRQLPESYKKLRIEVIAAEAISVPLICHATGKQAANAQELAAMNAEHVAKLDPEAAELLRSSAGLLDRIKELEAKIAAMETEPEKRGPGRPKKTS